MATLKMLYQTKDLMAFPFMAFYIVYGQDGETRAIKPFRFSFQVFNDEVFS